MDYGSDAYFMKQALAEAEKAYLADEVPVGAVVVSQGRILARAHNLTEKLIDVTAHAEMQAITAASSYLGGKYLDACTLYVSLEPCCMCAGALQWAHLGRLVFGAHDPRRGFSQQAPPVLHPKTAWLGGLLEDECAALLQQFFKSKR